MNEKINELTMKVDTLWNHYQIEQFTNETLNIFDIIEIPIIIFGIYVLFKINKVLKIYIEENKDFL